MSRTDQFFADKHLNENGIALYVDALMLERMESLPEELRRHVELCDECKHHIMQVTALMREQPQNTSVPHPFFDSLPIPANSYTPWIRAAAAVVIILAGGALFLLLNNPQLTERSDVTHLQTPVQQPQQEAAPQRERPDALLADNFTPSPNLDDLIASDFRSATVEADFPPNGATVRPPITFRWTTTHQQVKLKILSNKEVTLMTAIVAADSLVVTKKFEPGLYYWKLEDEDELLFLGKFFIR